MYAAIVKISKIIEFTDTAKPPRLSNWNLAGMPPQATRARCSAFRYCPSPLGIVTAEQLDKLEFIKLFLSEKTYNSFRPMGK